MKLAQRVRGAWAALTGKRDPYGATYGYGTPGGFAGAVISRLTASQPSWSGALNYDLDAALPILRARARSLSANNDHGKRFLSLVASNIVGRNHPMLQVRAMIYGRDNKATPDKALNSVVEDAWQRFGRSADITGRHKNLPAFWRMIVKAVARDGESLIRVVRDRKLPFGMAMQALDPDRLAHDLNRALPDGSRIRLGVEMDPSGRPVALWLRHGHPGERYDAGPLNLERVPIRDIYHVFLPERPEQARGVTWFHAVILRAGKLERFENAAITAAEIGASKIAALEQTPDAAIGGALTMADTTSDGTAAGLPQMRVEAGELFELPPGYRLSSWNPEYPHANFDSFLKACLRSISAGLDVAAHNLTGDMTDVNYSSARIAELAEREIWMCLQDWFIESLVRPIFEEWLSLALLRGDIQFANGNALPFTVLQKIKDASRFQGRRWPWVDPAKDQDANAAAVQLGVTSRQRIAAEQGEDFDDILDELAYEQDALKVAGLPTEVKPATTAAALAPIESPPPKNGKGMEKRLDDLFAMMRQLSSREVAPPPIRFEPKIEMRAGDTHVTLPEGCIQVEAVIEPPQVRVEQPAPAVQVNVEAPQVNVTNVVEPTPVTIETNVAPQVTLPPRHSVTTISTDASGIPIGSETIEKDA